MEFLTSDLDQSLNYVFRNGLKLNQPFYGCDGVDGFALGQPRQYVGAYFLTVGVVLLIIYIPCLIVIWKSDLMKSSCYKIMVCLGILDICCILTNSVTTGFLGIQGATFCSYPLFIYFMGSLGCGCWMGSCASCILLGINRCCDVNQHLRIRTIFLGRKMYFTISIPILYTIYSTFFTKPIIFNSNYMSWFFNPMLPGHEIFFQSVLICSFNAIAAYIYVYMQFFYSPPSVVLIGQLAWQCAHGSVCLIYITMNKTVRRGVIDLVVPRVIRDKARIGTNRAANIARPILSVIGMEPKIGGTTRTGTSSGTVF
ncbi:hypothetical protein L3Y34_005232 [Caenorhabditis briggsae]|uniref:Serpentine Receptor, class T n=1 Tax=Caenorhabditis briggsae TaxID=6238 RepID=A0AAE9AFR2_CAEBR|nr:hypothetical protein L3Y34_005232 [Caenorhabditis briggsae]